MELNSEVFATILNASMEKLLVLVLVLASASVLFGILAVRTYINARKPTWDAEAKAKNEQNELTKDMIRKSSEIMITSTAREERHLAAVEQMAKATNEWQSVLKSLTGTSDKTNENIAVLRSDMQRQLETMGGEIKALVGALGIEDGAKSGEHRVTLLEILKTVNDNLLEWRREITPTLRKHSTQTFRVISEPGGETPS